MKTFWMVLVVLLWAVQASAGLFVWTDDRGNTHYTDDEKKIPEKYREAAKEPAFEKPIVESQYRPETNAAVPEEDVQQEYGGKPVFFWVQQINRMEADLIEAQNAASILENELDVLKNLKLGQVRRNPIVGKYYSRPISSDSSLYFVDDNEKKLLKMKYDQVNQQIDAIKKEIDIFRNDAKKAGVPPKYL